MRSIDKIIVHCTASTQKATAASVVRYHTSPVAKGGRGWSTPGYHYIVEADGTVVATVPEERISNGVKGHNAHSINVCYIGGIDAKGNPCDNRTDAQKASLLTLLTDLRRRYPAAAILGHRDLAPKACPCFDAATEYRDL